jgi:hypothetical protein
MHHFCPLATLAQASCTHHPDRRGFALCMTCRRVVCQECATTFEGANTCRPCLLQREASALAAKKRQPPIWIAILAAGVLLAVASAWAMAWASAIVVGWM